MQRMPQGAKCTASHSVKLDIPAFAALYAGILVSGVNAFMDEMLMMFPPVFTMSAANTCVARNAVIMLRSNTNFKPLSSRAKKSLIPLVSGVMYSLSVVALGLLPPAPLMRKFTAPNAAFISSLARSRSDLSRQLHFTARAFSPISSATFFAASPFMSRSATFAPHSASARANSEQITPPAPVTATTLPLRSTLNGSFIFPPFGRLRKAP